MTLDVNSSFNGDTQKSWCNCEMNLDLNYEITLDQHTLTGRETGVVPGFRAEPRRFLHLRFAYLDSYRTVGLSNTVIPHNSSDA